MADEPHYPYIDCDEHGRQPGYIVCKHVIAGAQVAHFEEATPENLGLLICAECFKRDADEVEDDLHCVCAGHAAQHLAPERRLQ